MSNAQRLKMPAPWLERLHDLGIATEQRLLWVDIARQELLVCEAGDIKAVFPVSTAFNGTGCQQDSYQTPTGLHHISEKIGASQPPGMIFVGREPTGEIADILAVDQDSGMDLITSRILWLGGLEPGINQGGDVDSHNRYIYIHGTNEEGRIGQNVSHGCIRMTNGDVIDLYDQVETGTPVVIA